MIEVLLNGETHHIPDGLSLAALIESLDRDPRGVAIERNGEIVPKSAHDATTLQNGDQLEIVQFVGGG